MIGFLLTRFQWVLPGALSLCLLGQDISFAADVLYGAEFEFTNDALMSVNAPLSFR